MSDIETLFIFFVYSWAIIKLDNMVGEMIRKFQRRMKDEVKAEFHSW